MISSEDASMFIPILLILIMLSFILRLLMIALCSVKMVKIKWDLLSFVVKPAFGPVRNTVPHLSVRLLSESLDLYVFSMPLTVQIAADSQVPVFFERDSLTMLFPLAVHRADIPFANSAFLRQFVGKRLVLRHLILIEVGPRWHLFRQCLHPQSNIFFCDNPATSIAAQRPPKTFA